ncbi:MAG: hypothetical protein ABIS86_02185 [Streptosporangiaceae bacterium]
MSHGIKKGTAACLAVLSAAACAQTRDVSGVGKQAMVKSMVQKKQAVRLIGDGSTSDTGPQPSTWKPRKLAPGEQPPQFVVLSWDGAGAPAPNLFSRFRRLAKQHNAAMTFFLSGLYTLPASKKRLYHPPGRSRGDSAIPFLQDKSVHETIRQVGLAWREGHEIGTHFNGHFCGPGGVASWSPKEWRSEIDQAVSFVTHWKTNTGFTDLPALPFDYRKELIGSRTPCLEGRAGLLPTARKLGWKYDSSGTGQQVWPRRRHGLWNIPLQFVPMPGRSFEVLSMDYNFLANQSKGLNGPISKYDAWERQTRTGLLRGFDRAYEGNRAPLIVGNHFEEWNGGIYMNAVEDFVNEVAAKPKVKLVSFRQLVSWLELQDPATLARLCDLGVGEASDNWS